MTTKWTCIFSTRDGKLADIDRRVRAQYQVAGVLQPRRRIRSRPRIPLDRRPDSRAALSNRPSGGPLRKIEAGVDVIKAFDVSRDGNTLVYVGTSLLEPPRLYCLDRSTGKRTLVFDPTEERFRSIRLTRVEDFNFTNARGATIEGWLHYPAGFDPARKYPLIVHYYGGTEHTARDFNVGYTGANIHQYCANGYAVYVLNPSGAPGWGPEFSDLHVNDWGKIVCGEIIRGVQKLLDAKPFLDKGRIGAYGGSYGGFMTMLLTTQTDMFRSVIALYGISNIASYWGAGWWGFLYSGVATAESFPWNRPTSTSANRLSTGPTKSKHPRFFFTAWPTSMFPSPSPSRCSRP